MILKVVALGLAMFAFPAAAQDTGIGIDLGDLTENGLPLNETAERRSVSASGAEIKGLDKVSGNVLDLTLSAGETGSVGRLDVTLGECRYPEGNPAGEAYAWLEITDTLRGQRVFEGWMIATSPALNALDHARYDVWVIRCTSA